MRRKFISHLAIALAGSVFLAAALAADKPTTAALGSPAPDFTLQDQDGKSVSLSDYKGKIVVLEWVNWQCPFVQRHYGQKTMVNLADKYAGKNVAWLAINSTHTITNDINKQKSQQFATPYPILNDASGAVGHAYDARTTPDMFIVNTDGTLVYKGGIDNDPDGDSTHRVNYVDQALSEVTAGKSVSTPETKSYGCGVNTPTKGVHDGI